MHHHWLKDINESDMTLMPDTSTAFADPFMMSQQSMLRDV